MARSGALDGSRVVTYAIGCGAGVAPAAATSASPALGARAVSHITT